MGRAGAAVVDVLERSELGLEDLPSATVVRNTETVGEWAQSAVAETMRRARARQVAAALAGQDVKAARLSDDEIRRIVNEKRPLGAIEDLGQLRRAGREK